MQNKTIKASIVILLLAAVLFFAQPLIGVFAKNQSESLPHKLYFVSKYKGNIKIGDLVAFKIKRGQEYHSALIIKKVGGIGGDEIQISTCFNKECPTIYIVGKTNVGKIRKTRRDGSPLTPISEGTIPPNKYFVYTEHPLSFDSRYQEIGLIDISEIVGKAYVVR